MIRLDVFMAAVAMALLIAAFIYSYHIGGGLPEVEIDAIQAAPVCDKLGPYPYAGGLDMYVLVCPKREER